jgi:hypothetical protein
MLVARYSCGVAVNSAGSTGNGPFVVPGDGARVGGTAAAAWKPSTGVRGWLDFDG